MKNALLLSLILAVTTPMAAQSIEVPATQRPLLTKRTADWCTNCGAWGWTLFEGLLEDNSDKAVIVAAHYSGGLQNEAASAITANFGGFGQPTFFFNNENQNASSSTVTTVRAMIKDKVTQAAGDQPLAQTGLLAAYQGGVLEVHTRTRFFEQSEGVYTLGVYLIEKEYIGYQSSQGQNAEHKNILREYLTAGPFGDNLGSGSIPGGTETELPFEFELGDYDPENLAIATVIWKKEGDQYLFVNSNILTELEEGVISSASDPGRSILNLSLSPNPAKEISVIRWEIAEPLTNPEVLLTNAQGRHIRNIHRGRLAPGLHEFEVERPEVPGAYYILVRERGRTHFFKLIFQ